MLYVRLAELNILIKNRYDFITKICRDYVIDKPCIVDMEVEVSDEIIEAEISGSGGDFSNGYAEAICLYREICKQLPHRYSAYLFHGAVIEYDGDGYVFAAKSGTGKSTHISLWRKRFGEGVKVINGDKPIMRFLDGALYAYGTPWCGKEFWHTNARTKVKAFCFIERASENTIRRIGADEAVIRMFYQILTPADLAEVDAVFPLLDKTLRDIPCYVLGCNISEEAAEVAYNGMKEQN